MKSDELRRITLPAPDPVVMARAARRQAQLTKPAGSLGQLEHLAIRLAGQQGREAPSVDQVQVVVFAADHGVCEEGVSAFPQAVTGQMIANFAAGGAAISVLSRSLGAALEVVNLGTVTAVPAAPGVVNADIAPGTRNIAREPAMTAAEMAAAVAAGRDAVARGDEAELFIGGEMGIGNTTCSAALACVLLEEAPERLVGPGTGLDARGLSDKCEVVRRALARHGDDREPAAVLASLGGLELAALVGAYLAAAERRIPVLLDGFIASVAALVACRMQPDLRDWLYASHVSAEPGHARILSALELEPLLDLGLRLGEGSGAAVAVPLMRAACAIHNEMASFQDAGVSESAQAEGGRDD